MFFLGGVFWVPSRTLRLTRMIIIFVNEFLVVVCWEEDLVLFGVCLFFFEDFILRMSLGKRGPTQWNFSFHHAILFFFFLSFLFLFSPFSFLLLILSLPSPPKNYSLFLKILVIVKSVSGSPIKRIVNTIISSPFSVFRVLTF